MYSEILLGDKIKTTNFACEALSGSCSTYSCGQPKPASSPVGQEAF